MTLIIVNKEGLYSDEYAVNNLSRFPTTQSKIFPLQYRSSALVGMTGALVADKVSAFTFCESISAISLFLRTVKDKEINSMPFIESQIALLGYLIYLGYVTEFDEASCLVMTRYHNFSFRYDVAGEPFSYKNVADMMLEADSFMSAGSSLNIAQVFHRAGYSVAKIYAEASKIDTQVSRTYYASKRERLHYTVDNSLVIRDFRRIVSMIEENNATMLKILVILKDDIIRLLGVIYTFVKELKAFRKRYKVAKESPHSEKAINNAFDKANVVYQAFHKQNREERIAYFRYLTKDTE